MYACLCMQAGMQTHVSIQSKHTKMCIYIHIYTLYMHKHICGECICYRNHPKTAVQTLQRALSAGEARCLEPREVAQDLGLRGGLGI